MLAWREERPLLFANSPQPSCKPVRWRKAVRGQHARGKRCGPPRHHAGQPPTHVPKGCGAWRAREGWRARGKTPGPGEGPQGRGRQWAPGRGPPHKEGRININVTSVTVRGILKVEGKCAPQIAKSQTHRGGGGLWQDREQGKEWATGRASTAAFSDSCRPGPNRTSDPHPAL